MDDLNYCPHKECNIEIDFIKDNELLYNYKKLRKMRFIDERIQYKLIDTLRKSDQFAKVRNDIDNSDMMMNLVILSSFLGKQCGQCVHGNYINDVTYTYESIFFDVFGKQELEIFIEKHKSLKNACIATIYYSELEIPDEYNIDQLFNIGLFI